MLHTARPDPTATYAAFQGPGHQHVLVYAYGLEACAMVELCMFGDRRVLAIYRDRDAIRSLLPV